MTAPTTRETADHAELAEAHYIDLFRTIRGAGRSDSEKANAASKYLASILLSEIAALRVREAALIDGKTDMFRRATQAERQRDELRTALERLMRGYVNLLEIGRDRIVMLGGECDPVDRMENDDPVLVAARQVLANQGADQ